MKNGEDPSTPQGMNYLGSNERYDSSEQTFELLVDNKKIAEGSREECEGDTARFARDFRNPLEEFTLVPVEVQ